ncbi:MAG TPA: aminotransferase class III-fold pyridoxal phosphate-dependent enzyme [Stellaceae bacterium]|jgi:glutamate-1-semialdehyde 2,1-aminomutase|nr:aminotransferase class III-fold pyridoxal phosphate-dependent enzyme [Stellaceae bacterium]
MTPPDGAIQDGLIDAAKRVLPGGTFGNMAGDVVIREGRAGRVWDENGKEYVDFLLGSGPMLVGHAHPEVTAAAQARIAQGTTFFANNRWGIELAEAIVDAVPCAEQVRFVSTGSEADLYAMRAARAYTRRDKILKFEGGYHGMSDYSLMSLAPRRSANFPAAVPDSAGIPRSLRDEMLIAPFNNIEAVAGIVREHKDEIAAVILEPFQRIIAPAPGFLAALRKLTAENDIPLIFDEVVTGFRLAYGGAQQYYDVTPDLCTLGKVIGGGFPLAAISGRADIMAHFDKAKVGDDAFLMQIGTLSGNPVAAAAGLATLEILRRPGAYEQIHATGRELMASLSELLRDAGIAAQVIGEPPLFEVVFTTDTSPIRDYQGTARGDMEMARRFNALLREHGILKGEQKYYVSLAHNDDDIRHTREAWASAIKVLAK